MNGSHQTTGFAWPTTAASIAVCLAASMGCAPRTATAAPPATASPATASPAAASAGASAGARPNPFLGARFYIDPEYLTSVESTAAGLPDRAASLRKVKQFPTALWVDSIAKVSTVPGWLDDARRQQSGPGATPVVPVLVVYDLPNRDCAAKASAGELKVEEGGEARYRTEFIDKIAAQFAAHSDQKIVVILEPDSLANLVTNLNVPHCAASADVYRRSIAYAVSRLSLPHVSLYLDAAHAGWLGWNGNRNKMASIFKQVLTAAGGVEKIRGFATNVANFNILRGDDGKRLEPSNPCPDELTYVEKLAESLRAVGITDKGFIVDTSRNGRGGIRKRWGSWCNVKGAGLGERPTIAPSPLVDAYFWVKPPGASDGTSDPAAPRYDANCSGADSAQDAPQAGAWYPSYFLQLVANANPRL